MRRAQLLPLKVGFACDSRKWIVFLGLLFAGLACDEIDDSSVFCSTAEQAFSGGHSLLQKKVLREGAVPELEGAMSMLESRTAPSDVELHTSAIASKFLQDARDVLGIDPLSKLLPHVDRARKYIPPVHSFVAQVAIVTATVVLLCCLLLWVWRSGGQELAKVVLPVGTAVAMSVLFSLLCYRLGGFWSQFSPTTALITIVFVMEMGTFERFIIKNTLRGLGTLAGGVVAVTCAEISSLSGHYVFVMMAMCFAVFTIDAVFAKKYKEVSYIFSMVSVTFSLVFFGYLQKGWPSVWSRLFSVIMGEFIASLCMAGFSAAMGDWHSAKSASAAILKIDGILKKVIVAVDFAFARNMINSLTNEQADISHLKEHAFVPEVRDYFHLDHVNDLAELKRATSESTFATFPIDVQVSQLQTECRNAWADMQLVRGLAPYVFCGRQVFAELPNLSLIFDRVYPLYVQASAFAHSAPIEPRVWEVEGANLELIRECIQKVQEPFSNICKLQVKTLKDTGKILETAHFWRGSFLAEFKEIADALQAGSDGLAFVRKNMTCEAGGISQSVSSLHMLSKGRTSRRDPMWRVDAFCQSLEIVIAELSSLSIIFMKILRITEDVSSTNPEPEDTRGILPTFMALANMDAMDLDKANLDIKAEDITEFIQLLQRRPFEKCRQHLGEEGHVSTD